MAQPLFQTLFGVQSRWCLRPLLPLSITRVTWFWGQVFLLDGIDEMKQEYRYKNFYQTNNLEMYRGNGDPAYYPKVVYCTRAEMLVDMPKYHHMFAPLESENQAKDELHEALEYLDEFRIAPFGAKVAQ